jgi:hypothetical protein
LLGGDGDGAGNGDCNAKREKPIIDHGSLHTV